jgi:preprotein translocase subunit SecE
VPEKKAIQKNPNFFSRIGQGIQRAIRETIGELKKVSWPTRQEALNLTKIVLIVIAVMTVYLGVLDVFFSSLLRFILGT